MTVIQSQGRFAPVVKQYPFASNVTYSYGASAGFAPLLRGDAATTYEALFETQPILYAAVMKRVKGIARNPLKAYQYGLDGESRDRVRSHPVAQIIKRPHPYGSEFGWKAAIAKDLNLHGNALAFKVREQGAGSTPKELWPVPWRFVTVYRDEHRNVLGFEVSITGETYVVGREEVVHWELPGGSPLASLRRTLALEDAAQTYQGENIKNGVAPRTAFTTEGRLPENTIPRLRAELEKLYTGADNAGRVGIFDQGLKPNVIGMSPVDMDLISQRKLSRDEVCAVYELAPALLGLEHGTFNSTSEYRRALYDSIATDLVLIEETFQSQFVDPEPAWDGIFCEFDTNELLRPDPETRARIHMLSQQSSTTTVNERRRFENLPPIDEPAADTVFMPQNMLPVGDPIAPTEPTDDAGTPEQGLGQLVVSEALTSAFRDALKDLPAPVVNVALPDVAKARRIERDHAGNITRIIEE